jgi:hypothetical protein
MLGPLIGEGRGQRTGRRVVAVEPEAKVEVSFEEKITVLGFEGMSIGTYVSVVRADGSLHGSGEGIYMTNEGDSVTWKGLGVGRLDAGGSVAYSGSLSYNTNAQRLAKLNGVSGIFQFEVDPEGNTHSKAWELAPASASRGTAA